VRGVDGNQDMDIIAFIGILIFWLLLLGTLGDAISKVSFAEVFGSLDLYFYSYMRILDGILYGSKCISSLSTFGSGGIVEGF
jgi:hypothetical protein